MLWSTYVKRQPKPWLPLETSCLTMKWGDRSYCSVCDEISADRKLRLRAFHRRQARQKRSNIRPAHDHVLKRVFLFLIVAHHYCTSFEALDRCGYEWHVDQDMLLNATGTPPLFFDFGALDFIWPTVRARKRTSTKKWSDNGLQGSDFDENDGDRKRSKLRFDWHQNQ